MAVLFDCNWIPFLLLFVTCIILLYLYLTKNYNYWTSKGIPQTNTVPLLGSIHEFITKPMHEVQLERCTKYGRLFGTYEGMTPFLYVADPELLKYILVKDFHVFTNRRRFDFGEPTFNKGLTVLRDHEWKRVRSIITPTFTSGKMRKMAVLIKACLENLVRHGKAIAEKGEAFDCKPFYGAFTLDVIASVAFGTKVDSLQDRNNVFVKNAKMLGSQNKFKLILLFTAPRLFRFLGLQVLPKEVIEYYRRLTLEIIQRRKERNEKANDFLQLMVDAQEEVVEPSPKVKEEEIRRPVRSNKSLTMDEVLAQSMFFFLAGYDMSANPIAFITYNLALNPQCQENLIQEVDETWEKYGDVDFDIVMKMPYLHAVICESQRKISVSVRTERCCEEDYRLGNTGIVIPKGMTIVIPIYAMLHDPEWFPNPEVFNPERFMPENRSSIPQYAYIPFGEGPRNCIAERFAMMEIKLCLVYMLRYFRFTATEETKQPLEFYKGQPFLQPKKVIVKMEMR